MDNRYETAGFEDADSLAVEGARFSAQERISNKEK
jgi:hypothetical protein